EQEIPLVIYDADGKELYVPPCPLPERLDEAEELRPARELDGVPPDRVCRCYMKSYEELMKMAGELNKVTMNYMQLVETLVYILKATASFVPAAVYGVEKPDTSLYAHSILAAALASTGGEFYVAAVDVGRIQEYITRARRVGGAMSVLRGRSLRITLLQRIAIRRLIEEVNKRLGGDIVTYANVLLDTGGEAVLILPRVEGLEDIARRIEEEVLRESEGALTVYIHFSGPYREVEGFGNIMATLHRDMARRKFLYLEYPPPGNSGNAKSPRGLYRFSDTVCEFCGRPTARPQNDRIGKEEPILCNLCAEDLEVGKAARNLAAVAITRLPPVKRERWERCEVGGWSMLGYTALFMGGDECDVKDLAQLAREGFVYVVNSRSFVLGIDGVGYGFIYTNQHMPTDEAGVSSLDALKKYALFIKWDGNSMGERKVAASVSPSRLATFSAAVGVAYELYPALLAGVEKFRHSVYVVYAGGDDAVLAGDLAA
ncbi:MAG: type III-A CRISPR-associated protein Cas10/Csm1, partial [Pyrobaculum sp.]